MSNHELYERAQDSSDSEQYATCDEEHVRNLGATVERLMRRRGYQPEEFDNLTQDDFKLAA